MKNVRVKNSIPVTNVGKISNKSFNKRILKNQIEILNQLSDLRREMMKMKSKIKEMVEGEVKKELGDKINIISGTLNEVIIQKKILIDKGFITREEINRKYEQLKSGKNG